MQHYFIVLLFIAFIITSSNALSVTTENEKTTLLQITVPESDIVPRSLSDVGINDKRFLHTHDKTLSADGNTLDVEERAFSWLSNLKTLLKKKIPAKLRKIAKNKKYHQWLKDGEDPKTIAAKLGLSGKGPAAKLKDDPRFHEYLEFSALWRQKKGI